MLIKKKTEKKINSIFIFMSKEAAAAAVAKMRRREKSVEKEIWMHTHLMSWGKWWDETRRVSEWERERKK